MKNKNALTILSLLASSLLLAQTPPKAPNIGDMQRLVKPPKEVEKAQKQKRYTPPPKIQGSKEFAPTLSDSGKTIFVKSFKISGAEHLDASHLLKIISSYTNKDLTFTQLQEVTSLITKEYRSRGYFVARAYIPVQDISKNDGVVTIAIIEGKYGEFRLKNSSRVKDSIVQWMLDDAKRDNIVSTHTLERSMLIINDTPGVVVTTADVMPGVEVGTSDFDITSEASNMLDGYAIVDNTGSRYTGNNRLMAGINVNSPFKIGDRLSFNGLITDTADLKNARLAYSIPLMANGLRVEVSYSHTAYKLSKEYESLDARGESKIADMTLSYPIIRTRVQNLYTTINFANKEFEDEIRSTDDMTKKNIKSLNIGLDYDKTHLVNGLNSFTELNMNYTFGSLSFDDAAKELADKVGANTSGEYSKIVLDLQNTLKFTSKLSIESSLKFQHAFSNKNLDGSEDFSIGGSEGVKLYPDSEFSAENGYLLNLELKYALPNYNKLTNTLGVFYDRARAYMADNSVDFNSETLEDMGVGYYASYNSFFSKLQIAWNIDNQEVQSEPNRSSRVLFQGGWIF
jgi:hemolysin activation/secretion protein